MLRRLRVSLRQVVNQMARRPDVLCGAIVLSCLLILAIKLTCSRAKHVVAPARPPVRFFSHDAPVVDLFLGQLEQVERLRSLAEVSLIFLYAPWCAHSITAREEVQKVARRLSKEVQFIAVNCWWHHGKCRKQQNLYQYPVIHLFYRRFGPIEYKGPSTAAYLERFIRRVITPLTYLPSRAVLQDFLSSYEPGVIGYFEFNASPQPPGYMIFLTSALQALKRDYRGGVRFGVVTNKHVAEAISLQEDEAVYMHRHFNKSLIFPRAEQNFTSENICGWAYEHRETILRWLQPHGGKSRLMEQELGKGAALLFFLPFDPLAPSQPLVQQIADIALQYHTCNDSDWWESGHTSWDGLWQLSGRLAVAGTHCCNTVVLPCLDTVSHTRNVCELCLARSPPGQPGAARSPHCPFHRMKAALDSFYLKRSAFARLLARGTACSNVVHSYSPSSRFSACCKTVGPKVVSPPAPREPPPQASGAQAANITGLKCRTNKTLRFYLLDSHLHWTFAARLGARDNVRQAEFAAIVNLPDEVHYVLDHRESLKETLEQFIWNYSVPYSPLKRHLVGASVPKSPDSLIREVTTASFLSIVMDPEKDVLLFYYTHWCGFCSALNHIIIQIARLFQGNGKITVARVNAARNDLPWEFMVDHFPTLLFFPRERKHLSVKFPEDLRVTLPNLVRFVLRHSSLPQREGARTGLLEEELRRLQGEARLLQRAREQLSQQLALLGQEKRRLSLHAQTLETRNVELQQQGRRLEVLYQEKSQQLTDTVGKLQALAEASESLLAENTLLKVLLASVKEKAQPGPGAEQGFMGVRAEPDAENHGRS
ncbi:thioredoxin domain-containing protein 11 isoform X1 [Conger conger]|uniref:thioredoxin domain-containing protein 11 isoform X1 n=1 Tax=Conger conger TaxID=82655 RepID=UPI002A5AD8B1|nr:thioredoxin domain-containing protein 11 isoform X1 [Conger conger]